MVRETRSGRRMLECFIPIFGENASGSHILTKPLGGRRFPSSTMLEEISAKEKLKVDGLKISRGRIFELLCAQKQYWQFERWTFVGICFSIASSTGLVFERQYITRLTSLSPSSSHDLATPASATVLPSTLINAPRCVPPPDQLGTKRFSFPFSSPFSCSHAPRP